MWAEEVKRGGCKERLLSVDGGGAQGGKEVYSFTLMACLVRWA